MKFSPNYTQIFSFRAAVIIEAINKDILLLKVFLVILKNRVLAKTVKT